MQRTVLSLLLTATLLTGCGSAMINPVTGQAERSVMSEANEIAEGRKAHEEILREYGIVKNSRLQAYVNDLGQRLAQSSHRNNLQWHFTVLDSPEINAFALPGGYVYVTRGLMAYMEDEADLAGVIGHEIGHVTARHGAQRATRSQDAGLGVFAATILGAVLESQGLAGAGQAVSQVSQAVASGYVASYGREQELQADGLGAEYLSRSNYDPRNMINVITVLKNQERFAADQARSEGRNEQASGGWLSSHPSNDQRLQSITQLAAQYAGQRKGGYSDEGRDRYLQMIRGMGFGEGESQGLTRGRDFYHEPLGIALTAPFGWKIQNEAQAITIVNPTRDAALVIKTVPPQAGRSHEDVIRNVIKPEQGRVEKLVINGMSASHFSGVRRNAQGQRQDVEVTLVTGPRNQLYLMAYNAKNSGALQFSRRQLQEAQNSFRPISASERAAARPWSIQLTPFPRGGFSELARRSPLEQAEQQLRLMNGYYQGGEPRTGQMVKMVE